MIKSEILLLKLLEACETAEQATMLLQSYIQQVGPVSDEAGDTIKELLKKKGQ